MTKKEKKLIARINKRYAPVKNRREYRDRVMAGVLALAIIVSAVIASIAGAK